MSSALEPLVEQQLLDPLDLHFASLMVRLNRAASPALALTAALVSHAASSGDVCVSLAQLAGRRWGAQNALALPALTELEQLLRQSRVVGSPGAFRPLILDHGGRLYLQRFWHYEQQLADALLARASDRHGVDEQVLRQRLLRLFPRAPGATQVDWQAVAAAVAVLRGLTVVSGGPGSGKTTTVVRMLALLQQLSDNRLQIALAAPTGKAAARLQESIREARQRLPLTPALTAAIPEQAQTLHRLLGVRPGGGGARHHAENPLNCDLLVVDEASMVDLAMMVKLLLALPRASRLILLGDRHQLASVQAGSVLGDICSDSQGFSDAFAQQLAAVTGQPLGAAPTGASSPLGECVVLLRHSYRFASDSDIGRLARAVNTGDADGVLRDLQDPAIDDVARVAPTEPLVPLVLKAYRAYLDLAAGGGEPDAVFAAFNDFRLLTAFNRGERGAERLNTLIERGVVRSGVWRGVDEWYPGRPVVIRANDYDLGLYNGDIGLLLQDDAGRPRLCFPALEGGYRWLAPSRLPRHELAYAMTVHKSQGSEYAQVLLVLPEADAPLLTRELLYTALTRARSRFLVSATEAGIRTAVARRLARVSGLRERLWPALAE